MAALTRVSAALTAITGTRAAGVALVFALSLAAEVLPAAAASAEPVDLELVFAVDVSRSMDADEQAVQRDGYAEALTHPAVLSAITSGELRRIAIAYLEWGGPWSGRLVLDWTLIASEEDARAAAAQLRAVPVRSASGTSISAGLTQAAQLFVDNGFEGTRRVIDVSGDGPNNTGGPVAPVRDALVAAGIQINGLPVMIKRATGPFSLPDLDFYYEDCVIGGPGAFVVPVLEKSGFVAAIRLKMVMEIAALPPPARLRNAGMTDCMIGEQMRRRWIDMQGWE
ncbi:DUF1194 domain-containing protein [Oceanicella sp. SM1341]|uniref:DUF1194 domain-containing protein n=1 Tax=Oceanicella sp. SM1341 TaxID=1548889 RepID=UPI0018E552D4|nr:DUF1194 domain-containing protein [Oceanicella sp. SM1341]